MNMDSDRCAPSRRRFCALTGLALALPLVGCVSEPEAALRIGTNVWIGSEPLYLARGLGCFDPAVVQLVEYPSASEVLRAYRNQAIDGMVISLDELFGIAVDGLEPRIVLVVDVSNGADVVVGRAGMHTMRDLKGKSVAVESGALGAFVLSRALALSGMQASDVERRSPRVERACRRVREGTGRCRRHVRSVSRAIPARRRADALRQPADSRRDRRSARGARLGAGAGSPSRCSNSLQAGSRRSIT